MSPYDVIISKVFVVIEKWGKVVLHLSDVKDLHRYSSLIFYFYREDTTILKPNDGSKGCHLTVARRKETLRLKVTRERPELKLSSYYSLSFQSN